MIAAYWLAHYRLFASFVAIDPRLLVVNLFLLAMIVILPFTTEAAGDPEINDLPLPTVILALSIAAVSGAFTLIYVMARRRGILRTSPSPREFSWLVLTFLAPAVVFLVSVPIAYLATPAAAQLAWVSLLLINPLLGRAMARETASRTIDP